MISDPSDLRHLVVYEPRAEGHHLPWLRFVSDDLLSAGCRLTLALNNEPQNQSRIRDHLGSVLDECEIIPTDHPASQTVTQRVATLQSCLARSGASSVFLCAFDEVASALERRAFFGKFPPEQLRRRFGGIYHRPRFTIETALSANRWMKRVGFNRLIRNQWLRQLFVLDSDLARQWEVSFPGAPIRFLPHPCPEMTLVDPGAARRALNMDPGKKIFLLYGVGSRRKGLHLATEAFSQLPQEINAVLYCAGALNLDRMPKIKGQLSQLEKQGRARIIDRYVTDAETDQLFSAADFVLLPYLGHFGVSSVLAQAAAAGKPVIASEEYLMGRLVRSHDLGLLFPAGDVRALRCRIVEAGGADDRQLQRWKAAAHEFSTIYSRSAFRAALIQGLVPNGVHSA